MTTFNDLKFETRDDNFGGSRARHVFPNGYEASVIIGPNSHGGDRGLYELAVMLNGYLDYTTPITDDVLGHLEPSEVTKILAEIEALPAPVILF